VTLRLDEALAVLERTPASLRALLGGLGAEWLDANEGPETWSPRQVLGHLIVGEETDWVPRARIILEHGEARPFEPFDRLAHLSRSRGAPAPELLDDFARLRRDNLATVRAWSLTDEQLALRGRHPELGPVTLSQLLAAWVAHDLGHVTQIARVMAKRYADEVGPWSAYLSVLGRGPLS